MTEMERPSAQPRGTSIHDVVVSQLRPGPDAPETLAVVSFEDHLLRRFGSALVLRLPAGADFAALRETADEVWAILEGTAEFILDDTRPISPTRAARQVLRCESPTRFLLPFGVRLRIRPATEALLLRLMTHSVREDPPLPEDI